MRGASSSSPDGPMNIYDAILVAISKPAKDWGTTLVINDCIYDAFFVRKINTTNLAAFSSGIKGLLGYIANDKVVKVNNVIYEQHINLPDNNQFPQVEIIPYFAGAEGEQLKTAVDNGAKGIVLEAVGAGNVNPKMNDAVKYAISKNVAVIITSCVYWGEVVAEYGSIGGGANLQKEGAILAPLGLTSRKCQILLTLALGQNRSKDKLKDFFSYKSDN